MKIFIVTRGYPAKDRIYNHGFVHRRVKEYRKLGHAVEIFWLKPKGETSQYVHDGVEISVGPPDACLAQLARFGPDAIAFHAPADDFGPVLAGIPREIPVSGWIYGAEILSFYQLTERADDDIARWEKAQATFRRRIGFWRRLVADWPANFRLVFVSEHSAQEARANVGAAIPHWAVLPSPVDTALFHHVPKPPEERFQILSIRPFSDWRYANDLSVQAILALREHPLFTRFHFHFYGEGRLFSQILAPLAGLPNVSLHERFLTQPEIAAAHREAGVFLCPTRADAQGVTRDEAMASGLVPITSNVGPVPEFVDADCGFLTPPEDHLAMCDALATLAQTPARFTAMSAAAAARIQARLAMEHIIPRELELLAHMPG